MSDGLVHEITDKGMGLNKSRELEARTGINIFMYHPACGTYTRYLVNANLKLIQSGEIKAIEISTECEVCKQPLKVAIGTHEYKPKIGD